MSIPHITQKQAEILFTNSEGMLKLSNELIDKANARRATQDQFISAKEAEALGAGNAEFKLLDGCNVWHVTTSNCPYLDNALLSNTKIVYRAIRKEVPAEPKICTIKNLDTNIISTMTREAAKLLQAETKDVAEWFYPHGTIPYVYGNIIEYRVVGIADGWELT